eukprot:GHVT01014291.1.p2 GENE.GHVT01014291.1~~GHVT01014291.1.p2  ORF type:complete len:270 (-),score=29.14 GHVT01014291.1:3920-4729(-)
MAAFVSCICLRRVWAATASAAHLIVVHLCLAAARRLSKLRSLTWRGTPVAEDQNSWRRQLVSWAPRALMRLDGRRLSRSRQQHAERKIPQRPANEIVGHQPHATAAAQAEATSDQRRQNSTDGTERQRISTDGTEASLDVSSLHENDFEDTETDHDSSAMESTDVEPDATPKSDNGQTLGPTVTRVQCEQGRAGKARQPHSSSSSRARGKGLDKNIFWKLGVDRLTFMCCRFTQISLATRNWGRKVVWLNEPWTLLPCLLYEAIDELAC